MIRDQLLWRYFLLRDMPRWTSIDHVSMPRLQSLDAPLSSEEQSLEDGEESGDTEKGPKHDYMAEWVQLYP